jgi:hypothetical protein
MNQTNKEERSSAEPGEKRVRAKENIAPDPAPDPEMAKGGDIGGRPVVGE